MKIFADLHLHSRYSRATSKDMTLENLADWAAKKGLQLVGTGDFTHPIWFSELSSQLQEKRAGIYFIPQYQTVNFVLSAEISAIYSDKGKMRRIHLIVLAPSLEKAKILNQKLAGFGNLYADGRPVFGLSAEKLCEAIFSVDQDFVVIPAHIWTPWFSLFGSNSGYDSFFDCFGNFSEKILAIETGLSSDPAMNWRLSQLDEKSIVSFSDSHSPINLGREATVFDLSADFDYLELKSALHMGNNKILFTIEFFPEEGKYHYDGHRNCGVSFSPKEAKKLNFLCPKCRRPLTIGVLNRVEQLADREAENLEINHFIKGKAKRPGFVFAVPLIEIIADVYNQNKNSSFVKKIYDDTLSKAKEFEILLDFNEMELKQVCPKEVAEGILAVRRGEVEKIAGFDGQYGIIKIKKTSITETQASLF